MDPIMDTYDEAPLENQPNAVNPTGAEAAEYGTAIPPELYPTGATEEPAAANIIPGQSAADVVKHAGEEPERADTQADLVDSALPVPPQHIQDEADARQQQNAPAAAEGDDDDDMGDDLFGDAGDDDDDDDLAAQGGEEHRLPTPPEADDGLTPEERARRRALEYDEEELTGEMEQEREQMYQDEEKTYADVHLVNLPVPAGGKVWHARMPNFLEIRTKPFDSDEWDPKEEDLETNETDGAGEVKQRMVPDENVVRWRWTKDQLGEVVKQSNARIVRWSDGTLSLQLGSELFDMTLTLDHSAILTSATNSGLPLPPPVNSVTAGLTASSFDTSRGHGLTYLTARHNYSSREIVESHASVHGAVAFRPATLASQTHKRLAGMVAQRQLAAKGRSTKSAAFPELDPELQRQLNEKKKNEAAKKARRDAARAAGKSGRSGGRRAGAKKATKIEGLSDDDDDEDAAGEDDDDDAYYGGASSSRRSQPKRGRGGPARDYSDDDDGFVAKSDEDMEMSDAVDEEIEAADAAAERSEQRRKERARQERRDEDDGDAADESQAAPRRRMVVESDEEE